MCARKPRAARLSHQKGVNENHQLLSAFEMHLA
jgi:hypothetical protein